MKSKLLKCQECGRYGISDESVFKERNENSDTDLFSEDREKKKNHLIVLNLPGITKRVEKLNEKDYEKCPACQGQMVSVLPPRFGLEDKYQKYRIEAFKVKIQTKFDYLFDQS